MMNLKRALPMLAACCVALIASSSPAVTPAVLVGPDLKPVSVNLQSLRDGAITYFGQDRNLKTARAAEFVQVRFDHESPRDVKAPGVVVLTDGQRLPGRLVDADEQGQSIVWEHAQLGRAAISIDRIAHLRFGADGPGPAAPDDAANDRVVLENGDELAGFVSAIHVRGLELQPANAREPIVVPIDRLRSVTLSGNPPTRGERLDMVHLTDGTRVAATSLALAGDTVQLRGALFVDDEVQPVAVRQVTRIDLANPTYRLAALTDFTFDHMSQPVFGLDLPPRVEGGVLRLHAPVKIRFNLPESAVRFAAIAELDVYPATPADAVRWADFDLIVERDGEAVEHHRINAERRRATLNIAVARRVISLYLDPATNGPVMDRLRLVDTMVLLHDPQE